MAHICVSKLSISGSDNGLSPGRCQAIIWTSDVILLIGPLEKYFSEILIKIFCIFVHKNVFENVWKMAAILKWPQSVETSTSFCCAVDYAVQEKPIVAMMPFIIMPTFLWLLATRVVFMTKVSETSDGNIDIVITISLLMKKCAWFCCALFCSGCVINWCWIQAR